MATILILPSWILPSWIQPFCTKLWLKLVLWLKLIHSDSTWWYQPSLILPCWIQTLTIHSDSTWWWQPSWILPCWIQTLPSLDLLSSLITHSDTLLSSWILHLDCHLDSAKKTLTPNWVHLFQTQFNSTWWLSHWILPSWIQTLPSWIQTPCYLLSDSLNNTLPPLWPWLKLIQSD